MAKETSLARRSNQRERGDVNGRELRRSPRFLPKKNEAEEIPTTTKKKQPPSNSKKPSADETHLESPPNSPDQKGMSSIKKTTNHHRGLSTKCRKEPLRSIGNLQASPVLRRSARSASNPISDDKILKPNPNPNPRRSARLAAIVGKENVKQVEETRQYSIRPEEFAKDVEKERRQKKKVTYSVKVVEKEEMKRVKRDNKAILEVEEEREEKKKKTTNKIENNFQENLGRKEKMAVEFVGFQGWTTEQEAALQRAYLVAKPSPHFWKKVSKMVPGKSAQECFDRVNGSLETPPQPRPRSRSCRSNLSPIGTFSLSVNKCTQPAMPPVKRLSSRKKSLVAQKTVRHLLRKHCLIDQTREADYFTVLETSPDSLATDSPDIRSSETPGHMSSIPSFLQKCSGESSSAHQKMMSRFKPSSEANRPSPEVLKKIKNMALHEKYIDQLHCREARRNFARTSSTIAAKDGKNDCVPTKGAVLKAAKTALMSEAREVISEFKHMAANSHVNVNRDDADDDCDGYNDDDDDEDASGVD